MTKRLVWLALRVAAVLVVCFLVVLLLPLAVAVSYSWRRAFPERRRSTAPEWIGAVSLALLALRVRRALPPTDSKA
jgi:hypothetical protein